MRQKKEPIDATLRHLNNALKQRPSKAGAQVATALLLDKISDQLERQNELLEQLAVNGNPSGDGKAAAEPVERIASPPQSKKKRFRFFG